MGSLIILVAMFALLWVLLIRPQRKRQMEQRSLLSSIDEGDEVLTVGGLYGIVREIDEDDDLIVEIAEGIQVRIARRAVGSVVKPEPEGSEDDDVDEAEDDEGEVRALEAGDDGGAPQPETEVDDADEGAVVNDEETVSDTRPGPG